MSKEEKRSEEKERIQNYVKETRKNLELLKKGKKPKKKIKYIIKNHKIQTFTLLLIILASSITFPLLVKKPELDQKEKPEEKKIKQTIELLEQNYTDEEGLPVVEKGNYTETSELIILSALAYSMLYTAQFNIKIEEIKKQKENLQRIIEKESFVEIENRSKELPLFEQFLGSYALIQLFNVTKNTETGFDIDIVLLSLRKKINDFYEEEKKMFAEKELQEAYLIDQAIALWVLTTMLLYFRIESVYEYDLVEIIRETVNTLNQKFRDNSTNELIKIVNKETLEPIEKELDAFELITLAVALARLHQLRDYYFENEISSIGAFEKVINQYSDEQLRIYETKMGGKLLIKNQCWFTLGAYILHLTTTGNQSLNVINTYYWKENGFIENLEKKEKTAKANYYGLITLAAKDWSEKEYKYIKEVYRADQTRIGGYITIITMTMIAILRKIKMKRKKKQRIGEYN